MRNSIPLLVLGLLVARGAGPAGADATKPPEIKLTETPSDKLGTAPKGFGLKVGAKAPDATLPDVSGSTQSLAQLYAQGPTLVIFYRGGWCPFCNLQLHEYSAAKPEFDKRGVQIVAISRRRSTPPALTSCRYSRAAAPASSRPRWPAASS